MKQKIPLGLSNPELVKLWHPTRNAGLPLSSITSGSGRKVWWNCLINNNHEWQRTVRHMIEGANCPYCSHKKVSEMYNLAVLFPKIASEWHPIKNLPLQPNEVTPRNAKSIWWICKNAHEWKATTTNRTRKSGGNCPYCSNKRVLIEKSFAIKHPEIAKEWHPTKNFPFTAYLVSPGSNRKIWWKCQKGEDHEWEATIWSRVNGARCPYCIHQRPSINNCIAVTDSKLTAEWHPTKNGKLTPYDIVLGSEKMVWWKCPKGDDHEWKAPPMNRSKGVGCAVCSGKKVVLSNCLTTLRPDIASEWHTEKNMPLTPNDIAVYSGKKVWWRCSKNSNHEWEAPVNSRSSGFGCPYCSHLMVSDETSLAVLFPELVAEWHPTKNMELTPNGVTSRSGKKVWWQCSRNNTHIWNAVISNRSKGVGCPICANEINKRETEIYLLICRLFNDYVIERNYRPVFLGLLEYDIYLPELQLAIEHQGKQHYEPINYFGGEKSHHIQQERDTRKKQLSQANKITLIEYKYDEKINLELLMEKLAKNNIVYK